MTAIRKTGLVFVSCGQVTDAKSEWVLPTNSRLLARKRSGQPVDSIAQWCVVEGLDASFDRHTRTQAGGESSAGPSRRNMVVWAYFIDSKECSSFQLGIVAR